MFDLLVIAILLGLIPAVIARGKGRGFGAWWLYGAALFIVALPHALLLRHDRAAVERHLLSDPGNRKCPFCAEVIKAEAQVCRFCGRDLPAPRAASPGPYVVPRAGPPPLRGFAAPDTGPPDTADDERRRRTRPGDPWR